MVQKGLCSFDLCSMQDSERGPLVQKMGKRSPHPPPTAAFLKDLSRQGLGAESPGRSASTMPRKGRTGERYEGPHPSFSSQTSSKVIPSTTSIVVEMELSSLSVGCSPTWRVSRHKVGNADSSGFLRTKQRPPGNGQRWHLRQPPAELAGMLVVDSEH